MMCKTTFTSRWISTRDGLHCNACQHAYEKAKIAEHNESKHYKKRGLMFPDDVLLPKK